MSQETTSVAIIARDDTEALQETIRSVQGFADQVVVLDTGSEDDSCSQARQLGAEVFEFSWCDDFSAARNACLMHLRGRWILWLDAGETLDPAEVQSFREFVSADADTDKAYALLIRVPAMSSSAAAEQIARVRLVPNNPSLRFEGRVRETLDASLEAAGLTVDGLPYRLHRGMREHDLKRKAAKARRNLLLAEQAIKERGQLPVLLNCMGDALQTLQEDQKAAQFFRHAIAASQATSIDRLEAYYGLLTSLDSDTQRQEQLDVAVEANELFPLDSQLLCAMGGYLQAVGRTDVAGQCYENAFRFGQVTPTVWHVAEVRDIAAICASITWQIQGNTAAAQEILSAALEADSPSVRVRRHLIELLVKQGQRDEALAQAKLLPEETPHREALRSAIRGACLAVSKNWIAANAYLKTAYSAGCRDPICLRWYAISLLSSGEHQQALQVIEQWRSAEPNNAEVVKLQQAAQEQSAAGVPTQWRVDGPGRAGNLATPPSTAPNATHGKSPYLPPG